MNMKNRILLLAVFTLTTIYAIGQSTTTPKDTTRKPYVLTETMPEFPGSFNQYLIDNIKYPLAEKKAGKQGTVYVSFVVEKDGTITNVRIKKGIEGAPGLSEEAIRVIKLMPNWTPGKLNGHPVRIEMTQPIRFYLTGEVKKNKGRRK